MTTSPDSPETILVCVDGSIYTDSVSEHGAWASQRLRAPVTLIHVSTPPLSYDGPADYSGSLRADEMGTLLEKLTSVDEERGRLDQRKGELIVDHARGVLTAAGVPPQEVLHRRGSLVETLAEYDDTAQLIVLGKRGEHADFATLHLGANLERVVRGARVPVLVASRAFKAIERFAIAYDGGPSITKALTYVAASPLLKGLEAHLITVGQDNTETRGALNAAAAQLTKRGFTVKTQLQPGRPDQVIASYGEANAINLLVMGAYGHSRIRNLVIGSTTSATLRSCLVPVLLFR
ncbi:MAG: universal stress protein [Chloroflexia bacterium]|nr:universal stress protein [Chloroflexia bacterium]